MSTFCRCVLTGLPGGNPLAGIDIEMVRTDTMAIVQVVQTSKAGEALFTTAPPGPIFFRPRIIGHNWLLQITSPGFGRTLYDRVVDPAGLGTDLTFTSAIAGLAATGGTIGAVSGDYHEGAILTIPTTKNYVIEGIGHGILEDVNYTPVMGVQIHNPAGSGGFNGPVFHVDTGARLTLRGVEVHQDRAYDAIEAHTNPWIIIEDSYVHADAASGSAIDSSYQVRIHRSAVTTNGVEVIDVASSIVYLEASESRLSGGTVIDGSFGVCILEKCAIDDFTCDSLTIASSLRIEDCKSTGSIIVTGGQHKDCIITGNEVGGYLLVGYDGVGGTTNRFVVSDNDVQGLYIWMLGPNPGKAANIAILGPATGLTCTGNVGKGPTSPIIGSAGPIPTYVVEGGTLAYSAFAGNTQDGNHTAVYGPGIPLSMISGSGSGALDIIVDAGGLTVSWNAFTTRFNNVIVSVVAGTLALTDSTTNYVEVNSAGVVSANVVGFTADRIPLATVVTAGGDITSLTAATPSLYECTEVAAHLLVTDPHTAYLLAAGTRALVGNWNPGAFTIGNYDFSAHPASLYVGDANNSITLEAGGPIWTVDTGTDFLGYVRASNYFTFVIGGVEYFRVTATGLLVDTIGELTGDAGVTIETVLIKDGLVDGVDVSAIGGASHAAATLSADLATNLLGLTGQELTLDDQNIHTVFCGPEPPTGSAPPAFRLLVVSDIPDLSGTYATVASLAGYLLLAGRAGGQVAYGGTAAGENLTLGSTAHGTKGKILFGTSGYDEVNNRLGIAKSNPAYPLDVVGSAEISGLLGVGIAPYSNVALTLAGTVPSANNAFGMYLGTLHLAPTTGWNAYGFYSGGTVDVGAGDTVVNAFAGYIEAQAKAGAGAVTNAYGFYIVAPTIGVNNTSLYVAGGLSEFAGNAQFNYYIGAGSPPVATTRLLLKGTASIAGVRIRGGGATGEGFASPAAAQSAVYVTHQLTDPPAGGTTDAVNIYMSYIGDLSLVDTTLEGFEVATVISGVTVVPTQAVHGIESVAQIRGGGMAALAFPQLTGIYGDVNIPDTNCGTVTWARCLTATQPSGKATGNAITNAAGLYICADGSITVDVLTPTNAYGIYVLEPTLGTNKWAIYATGLIQTTGALTVGGAGTFSSYLDIAEMAAPANPAANVGRLYVADSAGTTVLYFKDSAGTITNLLAAGGALALDDLTDVNVPAPGDGNVLTWDNGAGEWVDAAPTGGGGVMDSAFLF